MDVGDSRIHLAMLYEFSVALPFTASMRFGLSRAAIFCPSVVLVRASALQYYRPFVCAYLDGFLVVKRLPSSGPYDGGTLPVL